MTAIRIIGLVMLVVGIGELIGIVAGAVYAAICEMRKDGER